MTTIKKADLVQSIADALQFISYYHPRDYLQALARAYEREQSPAAKDAIAGTPLAQSLDDEALESILDSVSFHTFARNQVIYR